MNEINTQTCSLEELAKWTPNHEELSSWNPSFRDFSIGNFLISQEDYSREVLKYGVNTSFFALAYSILSSKEKFAKHIEQYERVLSTLWNIDSTKPPEVVFSQKQNEVFGILRNYGYNNKKFKSLISATQGWNKLNLTERLREDFKKEDGINIRENMVNNMVGVGYKFASLTLRMFGYMDLVTVDSWAMKYTESRGYEFKHKNSGLKPNQYLEYEEKLKEFAQNSRVTPGHFQATIYAICSTWMKDSGYLSLNK